MLARETPERVLSCGASLRNTATCDQTVWASQRGRKDRACPEFESGNKGTAVRNDRFLCVETVQARLSPERRLHHLIAGKALKYFKNMDSLQIMAQCITSEKKLWQVDNFDSFLKQRRICLAEKLNKYLG